MNHMLVQSFAGLKLHNKLSFNHSKSCIKFNIQIFDVDLDVRIALCIPEDSLQRALGSLRLFCTTGLSALGGMKHSEWLKPVTMLAFRREWRRAGSKPTCHFYSSTS